MLLTNGYIQKRRGFSCDPRYYSFLFIISKKGIVLVKNGQIEVALYE
ncbi:MAG: hypothetical protein BAJALOKI2v1_470022, partial [Promethearchaeota archaeon]